jgi:hypothetical protein
LIILFSQNRPVQPDINRSLLNAPLIRPANPTKPNRWVPVEVWQSKGITAQEMTLPQGKHKTKLRMHEYFTRSDTICNSVLLQLVCAMLVLLTPLFYKHHSMLTRKTLNRAESTNLSNKLSFVVAK